MRRCLILTGLALASGCVHFQPRQLEPARTAGHLEARTLNDPDLRAFIQTNAPTIAPSNWPPSSWNLSLLAIAALYYHPDMEVARAKLAAADAAVISAGARPNPTLAFRQLTANRPSSSFRLGHLGSRWMCQLKQWASAAIASRKRGISPMRPGWTLRAPRGRCAVMFAMPGWICRPRI